MLRSIKRSMARVWARTAEILKVGWGSGVVYGGVGTSPRDQDAWLEAYIKCRVVRSVVNKLASDVAKIKIHLLEDGPDGRPRLVKKHGFLDWMKNPWRTNGGGSFADLIKLRQIHYEVCGEAFWYFRHPAGEKAYEAVPLLPPRVQFPMGEGRGYTLTVKPADLPRELDPERTVWFRDINPADPYGRGLGLATCLDDEVSQLEAAAKYNSAFFSNGATPSAIVSAPNIKSNLRDKIAEQWEARHQGADKAHRVAFIDVDTKVSQLGFSHKDLDFVPGQKFLRDAVLQAFGMPPEILGINENSNKATAQEALDLYQENTILPRDASLVFDLDRLVLQPIFNRGSGRKLYLGFQSPVRETEAFRLQKHSEMFGRGATSRDQYLVSQGADPIGGELGRQFLVPVNVTPVTPDNPNPVPENAKPAKEQRIFIPRSHSEWDEVRVILED